MFIPRIFTENKWTWTETTELADDIFDLLIAFFLFLPLLTLGVKYIKIPQISQYHKKIRPTAEARKKVQ